MSASCVCHAWGIVDLERTMFSAISLRTRVSWITSSPSASAGFDAGVAGAAGACLAFAANSCTSFLVTRPPRPEPRIPDRSTFSSSATICTAGEYRCSPDSKTSGAAGAGGGAGAGGAAAAACAGLSAATFGAGAGASGVAVTFPSPPSSTTAISAPAWTVWPSLARISLRMPVTGAGTSALTLSVSTSSIGSNSTTLSPGLTSHFEMVPSCTDSPSCGITTRVVLPAISVRCELLQHTGDLVRCGHEELFHGDRIRHRRYVEPSKALDRRVEPAPRLVCDQRHNLRPDRDAEVVLVQHQALACLSRGGDDRLPVERIDRAQVDDLDAHSLGLE